MKRTILLLAMLLCAGSAALAQDPPKGYTSYYGVPKWAEDANPGADSLNEAVFERITRAIRYPIANYLDSSKAYTTHIEFYTRRTTALPYKLTQSLYNDSTIWRIDGIDALRLTSSFFRVYKPFAVGQTGSLLDSIWTSADSLFIRSGAKRFKMLLAYDSAGSASAWGITKQKLLDSLNAASPSIANLTSQFRFSNVANDFFADTLVATTAIPSTSSGRFGWFTRNPSASQTGTVRTSTSTDSLFAGAFRVTGGGTNWLALVSGGRYTIKEYTYGLATVSWDVNNGSMKIQGGSSQLAPYFFFGISDSLGSSNVGFNLQTTANVYAVMRFKPASEVQTAKTLRVSSEGYQFMEGEFDGTLLATLTTTGLFGLGTSPSAKLHVQSTTEQIRASYDADNRLSITQAGSGGAVTVAGTGDWIFNMTGKDIYPYANYDQNLGLLSKKYLTLHAAELWVETLVAQNTIATIGGRVLVAPTTPLVVDLSTDSTSIQTKYNNLANGDRIYLEADGKVEFMAVTSAAVTNGSYYRYSVTRNLDGSGANVWYAGDAVLNTGTTGNGFIDLYSVRGVKASTEYGPTIVGNVRNSATYNDWSPRWAIGNLNGLYGYSSTTYGVAFGNYSAAWMGIDATNGIRIMSSTTAIGSWDASGNFTVGAVASGKTNLFINSSGLLQLRNNTTAKIQLAGDGTGFVGPWNFGATAFYNGKLTLTSTDAGVYLGTDGISLGSAGVAPQFKVTAAGALTATSATITGAITATSGTIGSFTIGTYLYSGSKTAWNDANAGVHIGSDGIGVGNNVFKVDGSTGALTTTSATITGAITALAINFRNDPVTGYAGSFVYPVFGADRQWTLPDITGTIIIASSVNSVSPTSPNRTLTITFGGNTYYIHAKTTND